MTIRKPRKKPEPSDHPVTVCTAVIGGGVLHDPVVVAEGVRYVCFTDQELESSVWEIRRVERWHHDPGRDSRRYKLRPFDHFRDADWVVWLDASMRLKSDVSWWHLERLCDERFPASMYRHPGRDCIYEEAEEVLRLGRDHREVVAGQVRDYRAKGFPEHFGLVSAGFIIWNMSHARVEQLSRFWWREYENGSRRDQMCFDYVRWLLKVEIDHVPGNIYQSPLFDFIVPNQEGRS